MDAAAWIALAGVVVTIAVNGGGYLVAWGAMKGAVSALGARVALLESQMRALDELKLDVARLETRLNASIRWMREPADSRPPRGQV